MADQTALRIGPSAFEGSELTLITSLEGQIRDAVRSDLDVLISGGTERVRRLLAKVIHRRSSRGKLSFVVLDLADIPTPVPGWPLPRLPRAATVFVAEIADLTSDNQVFFGRLLEARSRERAEGTVGPSDYHTQPRIVAGTAYDLTGRVQDGLFAPDLFYRLNTVHLLLPLADDTAERGEAV